MARAHQGELKNELSISQENLLANDRSLLITFYLLLNGWNACEIQEEYKLTKAQLTKRLTTLDKHKLIELLPYNKVKLTTARQIIWRRGGPIRLKYASQIKSEL